MVFLSGPASCLLAGGFICWCSVLSFLIQTLSLATSEQRRLSSIGYAAFHQAHLPPGPWSFVLSPPAAPSPAMLRYPSSACSGAEIRAAGWAGGKQEHFCCRKRKNPLSYQRRAGWARRGTSLQVFQSFWNPLLEPIIFLARSGWGRTRAAAGGS